jgi:hypothetical protein
MLVCLTDFIGNTASRQQEIIIGVTCIFDLLRADVKNTAINIDPGLCAVGRIRKSANLLLQLTQIFNMTCAKASC